MPELRSSDGVTAWILVDVKPSKNDNMLTTFLSLRYVPSHRCGIVPCKRRWPGPRQETAAYHAAGRQQVGFDLEPSCTSVLQSTPNQAGDRPWFAFRSSGIQGLNTAALSQALSGERECR